MVKCKHTMKKLIKLFIIFITLICFDNIIHLNNSSHFISSKIKTELFDIIYVSIAYNISIKESSWKGTYSEVNNLPMDKFNNTSVSVGFFF